MKKITLLLFFLPLICLGQNYHIAKLKNSAALFYQPNLDSKSYAVLKKTKKLSLIEYAGNGWWKIFYKNKIGYASNNVIVQDDFITQQIIIYDKIVLEDEMIKEREDQYKRIKRTNIKNIRDSIYNHFKMKPRYDFTYRQLRFFYFNEKKERDSLRLVIKYKDSINRIRQEQKKKDDFERRVNYISKVSLKNKSLACFYVQNEIDEFNKKRKIRTSSFNFSGTLDYDKPNVKFVRNGSVKYLIFDANMDLGCASSYKNNISYVKIKLENGKIVTFYHFNDIDCSSPTRIYGKLTPNDINNLKRSRIKTIRIMGTKYYHDYNVNFNDLFINKLDCIK